MHWIEATRRIFIFNNCKTRILKILSSLAKIDNEVVPRPDLFSSDEAKANRTLVTITKIANPRAAQEQYENELWQYPLASISGACYLNEKPFANFSERCGFQPESGLSITGPSNVTFRRSAHFCNILRPYYQLTVTQLSSQPFL